MAKRLHDRLLVVDIETVLDETLAPRNRDEGFAKSTWHEVVAISFVEARIDRAAGSEAFLIEDCRSGGEAVHDEARLLAGFWRYLEKAAPRLVTWNGRAHDMAVLRLRAMMHGVDVSCWSDRRGGHGGYQFRYAADWHCDLVDQLSDYGASLRLSLDEAANAFGFPGKIVLGPGDVASLHHAGKLDQIRAYCESDALNTFGLYLKWASTTGISSETDCRRGLDALRSFLHARRDTRPHFGTFVDRWPDSTSHEIAARRLPGTNAGSDRNVDPPRPMVPRQKPPALVPRASSIARLSGVRAPGG